MKTSDINFYKNKNFNTIYARFFLHSLTEKEEHSFFNFAKKILKPKGKIILEFRTIKDPLMKKGKKISRYERLTDHYRRFIDPKLLIKKMDKFFEVRFKLERFGLARFKNENPHVCRLILEKI